MVAQKLKELRITHEYTQAEIAKILNVSREAYSMYENAKRQLNYEALCVICDFYHVSIDYLFGRTDTSEPLSWDEQLLLLEYRKLDSRGKKNISDIAKLEYERAGREGFLPKNSENQSHL